MLAERLSGTLMVVGLHALYMMQAASLEPRSRHLHVSDRVETAFGWVGSLSNREQHLFSSGNVDSLPVEKINNKNRPGSQRNPCSSVARVPKRREAL